MVDEQHEGARCRKENKTSKNLDQHIFDFELKPRKKNNALRIMKDPPIYIGVALFLPGSFGCPVSTSFEIPANS